LRGALKYLQVSDSFKRCLRIHRMRFRFSALLPKQGRVKLHRLQHGRIVRPEICFTDFQRSLAKRLSLGILRFTVIEQSQIVQVGSNIKMIRPPTFLSWLLMPAQADVQLPGFSPAGPKSTGGSLRRSLFNFKFYWFYK
jgi:hypothetical protein